MEDYPVVINIFDVLYFNGIDRTGLTYQKRRKLIEKILDSSNNEYMKLVPQIIVKNTEQVEKFMADAIEKGCEGIMIKQLSSTYRAGAENLLG